MLRVMSFRDSVEYPASKGLTLPSQLASLLAWMGRGLHRMALTVCAHLITSSLDAHDRTDSKHPDSPNTTNVYRTYASIKLGQCKDDVSGIEFTQVKRYYAGIGSDHGMTWLRKLRAGAFGDGFEDQIRTVYEDICRLPPHPRNEIWLFGFSRGAYVVRAVAGLLHHLRILNTAGTDAFAKDYKLALEHYRSLRDASGTVHQGAMHHYLAEKTSEMPKIQFIGLFDTVKAVEDESLYDISFNGSVQHLRHALALHEDRRVFKPEYIWERLPPPRRSMVQAWFAGAHLDIGGSAAKDGLSLYPLQWMFSEASTKGLLLEFDGSFGNRARIDNPLALVYPQGSEISLHAITAKNGLQFDMYNLRPVHADQRFNQRYVVHLNRNNKALFTREPRRPFSKKGTLDGYCDFGM